MKAMGEYCIISLKKSNEEIHKGPYGNIIISTSESEDTVLKGVVVSTDFAFSSLKEGDVVYFKKNKIIATIDENEKEDIVAVHINDIIAVD